jgi:hypothetical protein
VKEQRGKINGKQFSSRAKFRKDTVTPKTKRGGKLMIGIAFKNGDPQHFLTAFRAPLTRAFDVDRGPGRPYWRSSLWWRALLTIVFVCLWSECCGRKGAFTFAAKEIASNEQWKVSGGNCECLDTPSSS